MSEDGASSSTNNTDSNNSRNQSAAGQGNATKISKHASPESKYGTETKNNSRANEDENYESARRILRKPTLENGKLAVQKVLNLWNKDEWRKIYTMLTPESRKRMSPEQFSLLMRITSPDEAVEHDPSLEWVFRKRSFRGSARDEMQIINMTFKKRTMIAMVAAVNITVRNVPLRLFSFTLVWQDGWLLKNGFFNSTALPESACSETGYSDYCYAQYGEAFHDANACDHSGKYIAECYNSFSQKPDTTAMTSACSEYKSKWDEDECLLDLALATANSNLCLATQMAHHGYECRGIIAGLHGDINECLDAVNRSANTASYDTDNCYLGFAVAQKNDSLCKRDWEDEDLRRVCYSEVKSAMRAS